MVFYMPQNHTNHHVSCSYEGEEEKGFYHGEGEAFLTGGHHYKVSHRDIEKRHVLTNFIFTVNPLNVFLPWQGQFADGMMHGNGIFTWNSNLVYEVHFFCDWK